jgi:hypothetical protein
MSRQFHVRVRPAKMSSQPARSLACAQTLELRQLNAAAGAEATERCCSSCYYGRCCCSCCRCRCWMLAASAHHGKDRSVVADEPRVGVEQIPPWCRSGKIRLHNPKANRQIQAQRHAQSVSCVQQRAGKHSRLACGRGSGNGQREPEREGGRRRTVAAARSMSS